MIALSSPLMRNCFLKDFDFQCQQPLVCCHVNWVGAVCFYPKIAEISVRPNATHMSYIFSPIQPFLLVFHFGTAFPLPSDLPFLSSLLYGPSDKRKRKVHFTTHKDREENGSSPSPPPP